MESMALFDEISGAHEKKFEVHSVQWVASVHFKCAHPETFQIKSLLEIGKFPFPYKYS